MASSSWDHPEPTGRRNLQLPAHCACLDGVWLEGSGNVTGSGVLTGDAHVDIVRIGWMTLSDLTLSSLSAKILALAM